MADKRHNLVVDSKRCLILHPTHSQPACRQEAPLFHLRDFLSGGGRRHSSNRSIIPHLRHIEQGYFRFIGYLQQPKYIIQGGGCGGGKLYRRVFLPHVIALSYSAFVSTSVLAAEMKSSSDITIALFSSLRERTETVPFSRSRSPTTRTYGIF